MKAILLSLLLTGVASSPVRAEPVTVATATAIPTDRRAPDRLADLEREEAAATVALKAAREDVAVARARWDAAVAAGHPVAAGTLARRHFAAMTVRNDAERRLNRVVERVDQMRFVTTR